MRRTRLATVACAAGLLAGCGSHTKAPTAPPTTTTTTGAGASTSAHGPAMATTGAAGKVGPGASGKYSARNSDVLFHVRIALVRFFTSKGFSGVTIHCKGTGAASASCEVMGSNKANQTSSAALTLSINQSNGVLRITRVSA